MAIPIDEYNSRDVSLDELLARPVRTPFVVRGLAQTWPSVRHACESDEAISRYIVRFDKAEPLDVLIAPPTAEGRFFYRPDMTGVNFNQQTVALRAFLQHLLMLRQQTKPPTLYIQSTPIERVLPGFARDNPSPFKRDVEIEPRLWIGNATRIATHFDMADNIAVVVSGRRRFTLFPPDQVSNLYVGPLDFTLAGQPVSLVDPESPDFTLYPMFAEALEASLIGELSPGDAIYIPSPWWHHVTALNSFNILVNYWWRDYPSDCGTPFNALIHGLLSLRHLPPAEREAWRAMFNHYVFEDNGDPGAHLPANALSALGPMTPDLAHKLRQWLAGQLRS